MRARLSDSSASSGSELERERGGGEGANGRCARGPPSRRAGAGERSAMGPAKAAGAPSSPRGRRLLLRLFLLTGAAAGRAAGAAGARPRRGAAGPAWLAPPSEAGFSLHQRCLCSREGKGKLSSRRRVRVLWVGKALQKRERAEASGPSEANGGILGPKWTPEPCKQERTRLKTALTTVDNTHRHTHQALLVY